MINNDIIVEAKDFNINQTLECGQIFRYKIFDNHAVVYTGSKKAVLRNLNSNEIIIENEDKDYFNNYFDLQTDYQAIKNQLIGKPFMNNAIKNGSGIRILRQDILETIISFIISANNNIPRIQEILNKIAKNNIFPTIDELANFTEQDFKNIGAGYRASYLTKTIKILADKNFDILMPYSLNGNDANKYLCDNLYGVGPKVADCILLFSYHKMDVFPVDTWIKKVYQDIFGEEIAPSKMRNKLIETYGNLSGYAQQYLFFNKRGK